MVLSQDNANFFWDNDNNRLGIGIATPLAQLHTTGTIRFAGALLLDPMNDLQNGNPEMLRQVNFYKPGDIEVGNDYMGLATWQMVDGYVVRATAQPESAATGANAEIEIARDTADYNMVTLTLPAGDTDQDFFPVDDHQLGVEPPGGVPSPVNDLRPGFLQPPDRFPVLFRVVIEESGDGHPPPGGALQVGQDLVAQPVGVEVELAEVERGFGPVDQGPDGVPVIPVGDHPDLSGQEKRRR